MAKYKVYFSGFSYIEADSEEEAEEILTMLKEIMKCVVEIPDFQTT
jgi:hypothetical protein